MYLMGIGGSQIPLCLDCYLKYVQASAIQMDVLGQQINYWSQHIDLATGMPGLTPKFPVRRSVYVGDVTLNNIRIDKSTIGVINTGTIGTVDAAITTLKQFGEQELAAAIQSLTEAVMSSTEASDEIRQQTVEILSILGTEAAAPKEQRRSTVIRRLLVDLATIISGVSSMAVLWQNYGPVIEGFFK